MEEKVFRLGHILYDYTNGYDSVCELGAGIFRLFRFYKCKTRVGIELIQSYVDGRVCDDDVVAICGDITKFEDLLDQHNFGNFTVITLIDVIEHLDKEVAIDVLKRAQKRAQRVLVFAPFGPDPQKGHEHWDFAQGLKLTRRFDEAEKSAAIEAQRHKATWWAEDLEKLGFNVLVHKNYHGPNHGAMWAWWDA